MTKNRDWSLLVVDDDPYSVRPFMEKLQDNGFSVRIETLNEGLLQLIQVEDFDLIVVDIMMDPEGIFESIEAHGGFVTGQLLAREIRDMKPDQKIVAFSLHQDADIQEWFDNQANMMVLKKGHVEIDAFPEILRKLLEDEEVSWELDGGTLFDAVQLKPSLFGIGVDLKKAWNSVKKR